jgi:hypothetical protein
VERWLRKFQPFLRPVTLVSSVSLVKNAKLTEVTILTEMTG